MATPTRPTKAQRRDEARAAVERLHAEQERKNRRQRTIVIGAVVGVIAIFAVLISLILAEGNRSALEEVALRPQGSTLSGGIPVGPEGVAGTTEGAADDAVVVAVYSDYMCPICGLFEQANAATLDEMREAGEIVVEYHPVAILDRASLGTAYSTRSVTAAALVADRAPEAFLAFNEAMFASQPAEGTVGLSDAEIAGLAREAGVSDDVAALIESGDYLGAADATEEELESTFVPWVVAATEQASQDLDRLATPTILLNGKALDPTYDWRTEGVLAEAIAAARG
jgi:protein-disulfide isomerase